MKPLGTRDLLLLILLLSVLLAVWKLRIEGSKRWLLSLAIFGPAALTALLHLRFRFSLRTAIAILYPLAIAYAFADGVAASVTWNRTPHGFFERNTLPIDSPPEFGMFCAKLWIFIGIPYAAVYACLAWTIRTSWKTSGFRAPVQATEEANE